MKKHATIIIILVSLTACGPRLVYQHLDRRDNNPEFRSGMQGLIMHPENMRSAAYQRKIDINTGLTLKLLVQLDQMLTEDQRLHLLDRIESLAADFDTLSCDPATRPKPNIN